MGCSKALQMLRAPLHINAKRVWSLTFLKLAKPPIQIFVELLALPFLLLVPSVSTIS